MASDSLLPPAPGGTRLIDRPNIPSSPTANRETDVRTALTRGLAEYVGQLTYDADGGRFLVFQKVFQTWAEPEDEADYPSAAVYANGPGDYDAARFTPSVSQANRVSLPDGRYLVSPCEYVLDIFLDVWATDPAQRLSLTAMLEDALSPVDWRYGLLLELPHYFNERASYELLTGGYADDAVAAQQRVRRSQMTIRARVSVSRLATFPQAQIRTPVKMDPVAGG